MAVTSDRRAGHAVSGEGGPEMGENPDRTSLGALMYQ